MLSPDREKTRKPNLVYVQVYTIKIENALQLAVRSKILSKHIFLQAVCDSSIARITGCVSSLRT